MGKKSNGWLFCFFLQKNRNFHMQLRGHLSIFFLFNQQEPAFFANIFSPQHCFLCHPGFLRHNILIFP